MAKKSPGRQPVKRIAAGVWLATEPWFSEWTIVPTYRDHRAEWKCVADAVRAAGFFSLSTSTIDVPVGKIVTAAIALRSATT